MRKILRKLLAWMLEQSLFQGLKEQKLMQLKERLEVITPDITDQYTNFKVDNQYLNVKVRGVHAFQISLVDRVIGEFSNPTIVDIGDSSGTHLQYIKGLYKQCRGLSVNLDPMAVEKIKAKGLEAILAHAENLSTYNINTDIFLCFETFEHLMNPSQFLHELSSKTSARYLIITVPYVRYSRVGLHHIRNHRTNPVSAEVTHIFELCPEDLKLLALHSGWSVVYDQAYLQYPRLHPLRITQPLWERLDFEGFYGIILKRDDTWSKRYTDW